MRFWDVAAIQLFCLSKEAIGCQNGVTSFAAWSRDGETIAVGGSDGEVRLLDGLTGIEKTKLQGRLADIRVITWSHDGSVVAAIDKNGQIALWSKESKRIIDRWDTILRGAFPISMKFAASGDKLAIELDWMRLGFSVPGGAILFDDMTRSNLEAYVDDFDHFKWWPGKGGLAVSRHKDATGHAVAWFPVYLTYVTAHPSGTIFGGTLEGNPNLFLFQLEGNVPKLEPNVSPPSTVVATPLAFVIEGNGYVDPIPSPVPNWLDQMLGRVLGSHWENWKFDQAAQAARVAQEKPPEWVEKYWNRLGLRYKKLLTAYLFVGLGVGLVGGCTGIFSGVTFWSALVTPVLCAGALHFVTQARRSRARMGTSLPEGMLNRRGRLGVLAGLAVTAALVFAIGGCLCGGLLTPLILWVGNRRQDFEILVVGASIGGAIGTAVSWGIAGLLLGPAIGLMKNAKKREIRGFLGLALGAVLGSVLPMVRENLFDDFLNVVPTGWDPIFKHVVFLAEQDRIVADSVVGLSVGAIVGATLGFFTLKSLLALAVGAMFGVSLEYSISNLPCFIAVPLAMTILGALIVTITGVVSRSPLPHGLFLATVISPPAALGMWIARDGDWLLGGFITGLVIGAIVGFVVRAGWAETIQGVIGGAVLSAAVAGGLAFLAQYVGAETSAAIGGMGLATLLRTHETVQSATFLESYCVQELPSWTNVFKRAGRAQD